MLPTRRGSTSSAGTIVHESRRRRRTKAGASTPCLECRKLVSSALVPPSEEDSITIDDKLTLLHYPGQSRSEFLPSANGPDPKSIPLYLRENLNSRVFTGIQELQRSAKECPVCSLLWQMLRGADDTMLDQAIKFSSADFNSTSLYMEDGGTDIEELLNPGPKVKVSALATLEYPPPVESTGHIVEAEPKPSPKSCWQYIYGRKRRSPETVWIDFCSYRVPTLRLELAVCYAAQPGSRRSTTATVQEDLIVFHPSVIDGNEFNQSGTHRPHLSLPILIPGDLRLQPHIKWNLLNSWLARYHRKPPILGVNGHPSRVLDLTKEGIVRLVEGSHKSYAALSHRWGASQRFTATTKNFCALKSGVAIDSLPQTFRDAISTTRRLGAGFLWIDALCIIQDDETDWRRESRVMGDVYMNATFVIAAHCASDDSEGFLSAALSTRRSIDLELLDTCELKGKVGICRRNNLEADVTSSALSKRGWVLQERFLATHTLHFTRHGVFSETRDEVFSEDGKIEPKVHKGMGTTFFGPSALPDLQYFLTSVGKDDAAQRVAERTPLGWLTLAEMYTNCELTRQEDKLFAIAGLARKIQSRKDSAWCAGMWGDRISRGLLWLPAHTLSSPRDPRAPSWSWAAWDGPTQYPEILQQGLFQARAQFISVHADSHLLEPPAVNWLDGPGLLRLRASITSLDNVILTCDCAQLGPGPERRGYLTTDHRDLPRLALKHYILAYTLRGRRKATSRREGVSRLIVRTDQLPPCGWLAFDNLNTDWTQQLTSDDESHVRLKDCYFALLGTCRASNGGLTYLGIFLRPIEGCDSEFPEYCRIGCGQLSHSFISSEYLEPQTRGHGGVAWSTKADDSDPQLPHDLGRVSTISIR